MAKKTTGKRVSNSHHTVKSQCKVCGTFRHKDMNGECWRCISRSTGKRFDWQCKHAYKGAPDRVCTRYKRKGEYCPFHERQHRGGKQSMGVPKNKFYGQRIGPTLRRYMEDAFADSTYAELINIREELELMRTIAGESVAVYSMAFSMPENHPNKAERMMAASALMQSALESVIRTCKIANDIEATAKDKFSLTQLQEVISQIQRFVNLCFGNYAAELVQFEEMLANRLRFPQPENNGTRLLPGDTDATVTEMDSSVPFV